MRDNKYNVGLDVLRVLSIFTVVLIHTPRLDIHDRNWFLQFLPPANACFAFMAGWFFCMGRPFGEWLKKRFVRLFIPYLIWEIVYYFWGLARCIYVGETIIIPTSSEWIEIVFFGGASGQLWFICYLFYAQCLLRIILEIFRRFNVSWAVLPFASFLMVLYSLCQWEGHLRLLLFLASYCALGIACKVICDFLMRSKDMKPLCVGVCFCLALCVVVSSWVIRIPLWVAVIAWTTSFGLINIKNPRMITLIKQAGACTMGIYLCHHLVPEYFVYKALPYLNPYSPDPRLLFFVTALFMFLLPFVAVWWFNVVKLKMISRIAK